MLASLPTSSVSESSIADWRPRLENQHGESLEREFHEEQGDLGLLGLVTRDNDDMVVNAFAVANGGDTPLNRNLATSVPGVVQVHRHLGSGTFGNVWECEMADGAGPVALKVLRPRPNAPSPARECQVHAGLQHPNLVQLLQAIEGPPSAIAMELCPGGTLAQLIHPPRGQEAVFTNITLRARVRAALDIVACLQYLHSSNVLHRDVKPSNCLLSSVLAAGSTEIPPVKLGDLGLARPSAQEMSRRVGTLIYMAPELMEGEDYGFPVDIYSSGMLLYELITGLVPFSTSGDRLRNDVAFVLAVSMGERPNLDNTMPPCAVGEDLRSIIESSWSEEPGSRPTACTLGEKLSSVWNAME